MHSEPAEIAALRRYCVAEQKKMRQNRPDRRGRYAVKVRPGYSRATGAACQGQTASDTAFSLPGSLANQPVQLPTGNAYTLLAWDS